MLSKKEKTVYPWATERVYAKELNSIIKDLEKAVISFLKSEHVTAESNKRMDWLLENLKRYYSENAVKGFVKTMINGVNRMATVNLNKAIDRHDKKPTFRDALGDLTDAEKVYMNSKMTENISLIKSVGDEYLNKVQDAIYRGWANGDQTKDIITQIQAAASEGGVTTVSQRRAQLIARDQVGKISGNLSRFKHMSAGINYFTWETAEDERVRPAHKAIDTKIFTWSDGWGGVFPGDPIACRCVAGAVFDDEAAEADDSDFWDPEAEDAILPSKKNGNPNPPNVELKRVEKPDMPYYGNIQNMPEWIKKIQNPMGLPSNVAGAMLGTEKSENVEPPQEVPQEPTVEAPKVVSQEAPVKVSVAKKQVETEKTGKTPGNNENSSKKPGNNGKIKGSEFQNATPKEFAKAVQEAKSKVAKEDAWRVTAYDEEHYVDSLLHITNGKSTIAISPSGDIISVCHADGDPIRGRDLLKIAIENGGTKLDSYDGNHGFYTRCGFEPVSWCKWDGEYAPDGWIGKPENIIFYRYTGKVSTESKTEFYSRVPASEDYDAAQKIRDDLVGKE